MTDLGGVPGKPPKVQNFLNFMQVLENLGGRVGWRVGDPPMLRGILDPPLLLTGD